VITTFREVMAGELRLGAAAPTPLRLALTVIAPGAVHPLTDLTARVTGTLEAPGLAGAAAVAGTMHIAPVRARRIRYRLEFTADDGRDLVFDGWKSIRFGRPVRSMTELPAAVRDAAGALVGEAYVRFDLRHELMPLLGSLRQAGTVADDVRDLMRPRWRGQPGRLEVWYTTLTDPGTGTGLWLHHELVAPSDGGPARAHGWAAVFAPDAAPVLRRFGPAPWRPVEGAVFAAGDVRAGVDRLTGSAGEVSWDLAVAGGGVPLYTFPRWAWHRELLPAAQIVPQPEARYTGTVHIGQSTLDLAGAPGNTAHIYGHGNARRWAWLHADLGGGDVCEVVAAVSTRPGLRRLAPLAFVRLRANGIELPPGDPLRAAPRWLAEIRLPTWRVQGRFGRYLVTITVTQPKDRTVSLDYADPDGAPAVCHNTERADARITIEKETDRAWRPVRRWDLAGTAHAEVGERPGAAASGG
jgi:hypothetical protein